MTLGSFAQRASVVVAVSVSGLASVSAAELQVGHYVSDPKNCQALENSSDSRSVTHVWITPDRDAFYNGETSCKIGKTAFDCEGQGDSNDFKVPIKIAKNGLSFAMQGRSLKLCADEIIQDTKSMIPMKPGVYVDQSVSCTNPAYAFIQSYFGERLSYGHGTCALKSVEKAGQSVKVVSDCFDVDGRFAEKRSSFYSIKKGTAYSESEQPDKPFKQNASMRWCGPSLKSISNAE